MASTSYLLIVLWTGLVSFFAKYSKYAQNMIQTSKNQYEIRYGKIWSLLIMIPLIIMVTFRDKWFGDTSAYINTFNSMPSDLSGLSTFVSLLTKDELYYISAALIKIFISDNYLVYFFVLATFQAFAVSKTFRKYSSDYFFCIFLFLTSTDYLSWMFNGIRQFTAVCMTLLCCGLILKKKYIPVILTILFASLFHGSALILIPFIFISQGKAWNKKTLMFLFAAIVIIFFVDSFTDILDSALSDTQYKNVVSDWTNSEDNGTNILRVLVYSVPTIISIFGKRIINLENNRLINFCTNMSIASTGIYLISMFTSGIFVGRLPIYFSLYSYILLAWEIENMFEKSTKKIVKILAMLFYGAFYLYSIRNML